MTNTVTSSDLSKFGAAGLIEVIARFTKDRECAICYQDGDEPNAECVEHTAFDMPSDDAVETLHALTDKCRLILDSEKDPDGPTREELIAVARQLFAEKSSDNIEVDDDARLSRAEKGSWVQAWVYVHYEDCEPEKCDECSGTRWPLEQHEDHCSLKSEDSHEATPD